MEKCDKINMQLSKAAEALSLKDLTTVRVTIPQIYHLDAEIVTVDNIWNILLIQFTLSSVSMYTDSVLLNQEEVNSIKPSSYSGMQVLDAVAQLVTDKLRNK